MTDSDLDSRLPQESGRLKDARLLLLGSGLLVTVLVALLSIFQPTFLQKADLLLYDAMVAARARPPQAMAPVLVGIDEQSLAAYGQWPWPRYRLAMLVDRLRRLGASVIALDFLMPEPDRSSPEVIEAERRRDLAGSTAPIPARRDSNSRRLAEALQRSPTVLGYYLDFSQRTAATGEQHGPAMPAGMVVTRPTRSTDRWPRPLGQIGSLPILADAASAEGFINALEDVDGVLRRAPLLLPAPERKELLPSLALTALLLTTEQRALRLTKNPTETVLHWENRAIPLDAAGNMLIDFRGEAFPYVSARAVLEGETEADALRGRIVLIGGWASGLGDWHTVPSGKLLNGLEVHASVIDNILAGTYVARPDWARGAELVAVLAAGIVCTLLLMRSHFAVSLLVVSAGSVGLYWGARELLVVEGVHISPLLPIVALVGVTSVLSLLKHEIESRKVRRRTRDLLEAQDEIIVSMSVLAEARDQDTGQHIRRTQRYVEILARQLARTPKYAGLTASDIELLAKSAPLHDIGKVGIPDSILQKPGKFTEAEYAVMRSHTLIGTEALNRIVVGSGHPEKQHFLDYARQMIESHHECWDGSGYPHGLRGEEIPLAGRLMALADVYDALISERVYKKEMTHAEVREFIAARSGTQFDPDVVAAFVAKNEEFLKVAHRFADAAEGLGQPLTPP